MIQKIKDKERAVTKNHNDIKYRIRKQEEDEANDLLKEFMEQSEEHLYEDRELRGSTD